MTLGEISAGYREQLAPLYDSEEAMAIFYIVAAHFLSLTKVQFYAIKEQRLSPDKIGPLSRALEELKTGKPVQYITGETEFFGLTFKVGPPVLIPRPETEELVQWVLDSRQPSVISLQPSAPCVLDIGTGSGCIPIAIKKRLPSALVFGLDVSAMALEIAVANAALNQARVTFTKADILEDEVQLLLKDENGRQVKPDVIISNPPYITAGERENMHINVKEHEPAIALFVDGPDPLVFYKVIAGFARNNLASPGQLFFEINPAFGGELRQLLKELGFSEIRVRNDLNGKPRMIKAVLADR